VQAAVHPVVRHKKTCRRMWMRSQRSTEAFLCLTRLSVYHACPLEGGCFIDCAAQTGALSRRIHPICSRQCYTSAQEARTAED